MTYSWSILVVMLVGIAMWQLGIFNLGKSTSTTFSGFPRIKPQLTLVVVGVDGTMTGYFTNGAGGPITVTASTGDCDFTHPTGSISAGQNFLINGTNCNVTGTLGDPYNIEVLLSYRVLSAGETADHREYGMLRGPME